MDVTLAELNISLNHFDSRPMHNTALQLSAQANDGTQLNYTGELSLSPLLSKGHLQLQDAQLKSWWPYVREHFSAQLKSGRLSLDSRYELTLEHELQLQQHNSRAFHECVDQEQPLLRCRSQSTKAI